MPIIYTRIVTGFKLIHRYRQKAKEGKNYLCEIDENGKFIRIVKEEEKR